MADGLEQTKAFRDSVVRQNQAQRFQQLRQQQAIGQTISELTADPRWELFGRHLESVKRFHEAKLAKANSRLTDSVLKGEEYVEVKVEQAKAMGAVAALTVGLTIAKTLIERGEEAAKELKLVDNGEKPE